MSLHTEINPQRGEMEGSFLPAHNELHTLYKLNASSCETLGVIFIPQAQSSPFKVTFLISLVQFSACCKKPRCVNAMTLPAEDMEHRDKIGAWWAAVLGWHYWGISLVFQYLQVLCWIYLSEKSLVSIFQAQLFASLQRVSLFHRFHFSLGRQLHQWWTKPELFQCSAATHGQF